MSSRRLRPPLVPFVAPPLSQKVSLDAGGAFASAAKTVFTGPGARASNDPLRRDALNEVKGVSTVKDGEISETLPPLSLTVYRIAK